MGKLIEYRCPGSKSSIDFILGNTGVFARFGYNLFIGYALVSRTGENVSNNGFFPAKGATKYGNH
jgi:hypothetical protein